MTSHKQPHLDLGRSCIINAFYPSLSMALNVEQLPRVIWC